jgi:hypothetical protein
MSEPVAKEYTAALCHMRDVEVVPFEYKQATAASCAKGYRVVSVGR